MIGDIVVVEPDDTKLMSHVISAYTEFNRKSFSFPIKSRVPIKPGTIGIIIDECKKANGAVLLVLISGDVSTQVWISERYLRKV